MKKITWVPGVSERLARGVLPTLVPSTKTCPQGCACRLDVAVHA